MGIRALAFAGMALFASLFMSASPVFGPAARALQALLWLPLCLGLGLLAVHFLARRVAADSTDAAPQKVNVSHMPTDRQPSGKGIVPVRSTTTRSTGLRDAGTGSERKQPSTLADAIPHQASRWSSEVFAAIEWRRFEAVVETLFAQAGFETRSQSHGADGGVDIWLHSKNAEGPVSVVQCKHWQGKAVTVKEMREFLGVMVSKGVKRGTYATTSRYTADAHTFAQAHGINAQDGNGLLKLIAQRTPEQQARLLEVAYEGEYWKPTCARCGVKMTERTSGKDGSGFWGCMNFPRCKSRLPMRMA
jgi:restriction system protein